MSEPQALLKSLIGTKVVNIDFDVDRKTLYIAFRGEQQGYYLEVRCVDPETGLASGKAQLDWVLGSEITQGVIASTESGLSNNAKDETSIAGQVSLETDASLEPLLHQLLLKAFPSAVVTYQGVIPGAPRQVEHLEVGEALKIAYKGMLGYFTITGGLRPNWEVLRYLVLSIRRKYRGSERLHPTRLILTRTIGTSGSVSEEIDLVTAEPEVVINVVEKWIQSRPSKS